MILVEIWLKKWGGEDFYEALPRLATIEWPGWSAVRLEIRFTPARPQPQQPACLLAICKTTCPAPTAYNPPVVENTRCGLKSSDCGAAKVECGFQKEPSPFL